MFSLGALTKEQPWPPTDEAKGRQAEYTENMALRSNDYKQLSLVDGSSWQDINRYLREDAKKELALFMGYCAFQTRVENALLWGTPPEITAANESDNTVLSELIISSGLQRARKEVGWDVSSLGTGLFKIWQDVEGTVKINATCPDIWYPVVDESNIRDVKYHVLANQFSQGDKGYLKVEIHSKDEIENRVYALQDGLNIQANRIGDLQDLSAFFPGLKEVQDNPIGEFLVVPVHNIRLSNEIYGQSDYSHDLKSILQALILRYSQRQRILNKHADPNIVAPKGAFKEWDPALQKNIARAGGRLIEYDHDPGTTAPNIYYLTWDANMSAVEKEIRDLKAEFCTLSGMPPQFFMLQSDGGAALGTDSGTSIYYKSQNLLSRVSDLKEEFDEALKQVIKVATMLQGKEIVPSIKWNDGFKGHFSEQSISVSQLVSSGLWVGEEGAIQGMLKLGYSQEVAEKVAKDATRQQGAI
jgi:hypothetical protein